MDQPPMAQPPMDQLILRPPQHPQTKQGLKGAFPQFYSKNKLEGGYKLLGRGAGAGAGLHWGAAPTPCPYLLLSLML